MRRHASILLVAIFGLCFSASALAEMVWSQRTGPHRVLLYKEAGRDSYYCTWVINLDPGYAAFDLIAQRPLMFRIFWKKEAAEGMPDKGYLHAIVDGADFPFLYSKLHRDLQIEAVGEFVGIGQRTPNELWSMLAKAQSFRVYLPSG